MYTKGRQTLGSERIKERKIRSRERNESNGIKEKGRKEEKEEKSLHLLEI